MTNESRRRVRFGRVQWTCVIAALTLGAIGAPTAKSSSANRLLVFADLKRSLAGQEGPRNVITVDNYKAIIDGVAANLMSNGIRTYIDPGQDADHYPPIYDAVYRYAREKGLKIYANPLGVGSHGFDNKKYAVWIAAYANTWKPDYLGAFNESGLRAPDLIDIARMVRKSVKYQVEMVGPDVQHVDVCLRLAADRNVAASFDIIGCHNAAMDNSATVTNWAAVQKSSRKPTWATENPRAWSALRDGDHQEIGTKAIVSPESRVSGLVIYLAFPRAVDTAGRLTVTGQAIAEGIRAAAGQ